jgi:hypothetical protein
MFAESLRSRTERVELLRPDSRGTVRWRNLACDWLGSIKRAAHAFFKGPHLAADRGHGAGLLAGPDDLRRLRTGRPRRRGRRDLVVAGPLLARHRGGRRRRRSGHDAAARLGRNTGSTPAARLGRPAPHRTPGRPPIATGRTAPRHERALRTLLRWRDAHPPGGLRRSEGDCDKVCHSVSTG